MLCVCLHLIEVCFLFMTDVTNPNDWNVFVCVVGPGFDSTSPAFVRSRASQAAGSDGWLAQKTESGPHLWGQGFSRDNLCRSLHHSNLVQTVSSLNIASSSSSCHQTILFRSTVYCFPTSLNIIRSSKEQACASW